jgi:hypothetical protein
MEHQHDPFEPEEVELDDDLEALAAESVDDDFAQEPDDEELRRFMGS